jgi:hypothetical protein
MTKLESFHAEGNAVRQNRLLFDWLSDDGERAALYAELRAAGFPVLKFKSVLRTADTDDWPNQDVYFLSKREHVEAALKHYSVAPYAALGSGGRFMLGLDDRAPHDAQNKAAADALRFSRDELEACAKEAWRRAAILPLKNHVFNLPLDVAERAALHFVQLLFGFRDQGRGFLHPAMRATYTRLVFQIIGRHFVSDTGLPPDGSPAAVELKERLDEEIRKGARERTDRFLLDKGLPEETVIGRLFRYYGDDHRGTEDAIVVALGLVAGTIGNVSAAVSVVIDDFFTPRDGAEPLIDEAQRAARSPGKALEGLVRKAFLRHPPAPFLARTAVGEERTFTDAKGRTVTIPAGADLLLAVGAEPDEALVFGGAYGAGFIHRCIGEHLAWPLTVQIVRGVLLLPGLARVIDSDGEPSKLEKRWGVICERYPLQFQRDRLLNQQPLFVVLPIKAPVAENARKLEALTAGGAHTVEDALNGSHHVHFAWFTLIEGGTHLAMTTAYDGDFDAYVEHFAVMVDLFDEQFKLLDVDQPLPIREHPKEFVENIRKYNRAPMGRYFYSAYPKVSVADIENATKDAP